MLLAAVIVLLSAAFGGLTLAWLVWRGRPVPRRVGLLHGLVALTGIVLLIAYDLRFPHDIPLNAAAVVFLLAASGGLMLLVFRLIRQPLPGFMLSLHALAAVSGIVLLLVGYARA